jgi:hypothetical protein
VRLVAAGHYWPDRTEQLTEPDDAHARLGMVSAGLRGCWVSLGRFEVGVCTGPEVGRIAGSGHGLDSEQQASDRWSAVLVDLRFGYVPAEWMRLTLNSEAAAALERPRFTVSLDSGRSASALRLLSYQAARFPRGVFASEREALRILAQCASGTSASSRSMAERFVRTHPRSPLVDRVSRACGLQKSEIEK